MVGSVHFVDLYKFLTHGGVRPLCGSNLLVVRKMKRFNENDFFATLKSHGSPLPFKSNGKQREFYERWLKSPGFGVWLARQEELVEAALRQR